MSLTISTQGNSFLINNTQVDKGAVRFNYTNDTVFAPGYMFSPVNISDVNCDGETFDTIESIKSWIGTNLFNDGGGDGTGSQINSAQYGLNIIGSIDYDSPLADVNLTPNPWTAIDLPSATAGGPPVADRVQLIEIEHMPGGVLDRWRPKGRGARFIIEYHDNGVNPIDPITGTIRTEAKSRIPDPTTTPIDMWDDPIGSVRWYGFSVYVTSDFPTGDNTGDQWMVITQLKGLNGDTAPIAVEIAQQNFKFAGKRGNDGKFPTVFVPFVRGSWNRIEFGVKLSTSETEGWFEGWINGVQIIAKTATSTMDIIGGNPDPVYLKQGMYKRISFKAEHTLCFGPVLIGTNHDSVKYENQIPVFSKDIIDFPTKDYVQQKIAEALAGM